MYLRRFCLILPLTICLKRRWSRLIPEIIGTACLFPIRGTPTLSVYFLPGKGRPYLLFPFHISASEDGRHERQNVGGADLTVAVVLNQPALDDIDLLLGALVDDIRHEARQLDGVLLVLEQLELERLVQPLVRLVIELPAFQGQGADIVHHFPAEIVLTA